MTCELCDGPGGEVLKNDAVCRVVLVAGAEQAGFCRVILNRHVREMTDLTEAERAHVMATVFATEAAVRAVVKPLKMNLASLGNMTPHVHWHVIPRHADDSHFPDAIWAPARRSAAARAVPLDGAALARALRAHLGGAG